MSEELLRRAVEALERIAASQQESVAQNDSYQALQKEIAEKSQDNVRAAIEQQRVMAANSSAYEARQRAFLKGRPVKARPWWAFW